MDFGGLKGTWNIFGGLEIISTGMFAWKQMLSIEKFKFPPCYHTTQ